MDVMEKLLQWKAEYLDNLGRYGKVVSKEDWANIKNSNIEFYRELLGPDSIGYCYYYSRKLALFLKDVKIIYCCIELDGLPSDDSTSEIILAIVSTIFCSYFTAFAKAV